MDSTSKPACGAASETSIKLTALDSACETSFNKGHYQLIFDKTGNAEVFFRYKAHLIEVNKLQIGITIGKYTKDEAIEQIRKGLVYAMRTGDRLVLYCGNIAPDFKEGLSSDAQNFPSELVFNFAEWRKEANYKKIVREDEDHDLMGNKKCFWMNDKFNLIVLQNDDDEETRQELIDRIPHIESFDIINIQA
eukprot:403368382